jgi:hypothetical protein
LSAHHGHVVGVLVAFARALRSAGLAVGSGDVLTYSAAMAVLDPADLLDVYWGGRTTLVTRRDDIPVYDEVFRAFFLGEDAPYKTMTTFHKAETQVVLEVPATDPAREERNEETLLGLMASTVDVLRHKSFAACTPEELAAVRRLTARMRLIPPNRRTRRTRPTRSGRVPDLRRTVRKSLRTQGEPAALAWRRRRVKARPLILILDVSGSMAEYSRTLLQFAYSAKRAASRVEVFCFGTRLTRITKPLRTKSVDDALDRAGRAVVDWEGGTRIGDSLAAFVRDWGRRGLCRGGVVVICSDGLDRGDPDVLAKAMRRLSLLCHRVVWLNPHGSGALGMAVATPFVDLVWSGRDLGSLEELAAVLPRLG